MDTSVIRALQSNAGSDSDEDESRESVDTSNYYTEDDDEPKNPR